MAAELERFAAATLGGSDLPPERVEDFRDFSAIEWTFTIGVIEMMRVGVWQSD